MTRGCEIALTALEWTESKKPESKEMQKGHVQSFVAAAVHIHHPATCFNNWDTRETKKAVHMKVSE